MIAITRWKLAAERFTNPRRMGSGPSTARRATTLIEDSIAPIHDRAGKPTGAVIVFGVSDLSDTVQ